MRGLGAGRENAFQIIRAVAVFGAQEFVGDFGQPPGQGGGDGVEIGPGILARDGPHGVNVLLDERKRYTGPVRACVR